METLFPILFAAVVGFGHAFEADHLIAVANLVSKRNTFWLAVKDGIAWGLGHTSTILLVGLLIIGLKIGISEQVFSYLEAGVGFMLITLGIFRLSVLARGGNAAQLHFHFADLLFWRKKENKGLKAAPFAWRTIGYKPQDISTLRIATPRRHEHHLAYGVGLIHGLAGSGSLIVLVMSQINSLGLSLLYLLIFGFGSIVGMLLAGGLFSLPFSKKISSHRYLQLGLTLLSSLLCIIYGGMVVWENLAG
ncbi:MAG: hypothetical protein J0L99_00405 [Chitinophagales bacterium]|nr:hypothetical protein [Chitinophagales bacterium]